MIPPMVEAGKTSKTTSPLRIAVIDNRDSFVFNLVRYLEELGCECTVFENSVESAALTGFDGVLISPGPGRPEQAGNSISIVTWAQREGIPLIGVCLGHQAIACAFGGEVGGAERLIHGATSSIRHDGEGLFHGVPQDFTATRYHSLAVRKMPPALIATAHSDDGEVMALRHRSAPILGVQFHPESVLTEHGHTILRNWLDYFTA